MLENNMLEHFVRKHSVRTLIVRKESVAPLMDGSQESFFTIKNERARLAMKLIRS
jgi:hypothetical protein